MAINAVPLTPLPTPPLKTDPANFAERADTFVSALPGLVTETNAMITEVNKITSGLDQATPIAAWAAGTTYNFPDVVAGSDGYSYRCVTTACVGVDPTTDDGSNWVCLTSRDTGLPVGTVVPFVGGYFTNGSNGGFTNVIGNDAATVNALVNSRGWYVCNGAACNVSGAPVFSTAGRYLPNLTDGRFLMGSTSAGSIGGNNSSAHTHTTGDFTLTTSHIPSHRHEGMAASNGTGISYYSNNLFKGADPYGGTGLAATMTHDYGPYAVYTAYAGGGAAHNHGATGAASVTENRPAFLSCLYLIKVI